MDRIAAYIRKTLADDGYSQTVIDAVMDQERQPELSRSYRLGLAIAAAKRISAAMEPA